MSSIKVVRRYCLLVENLLTVVEENVEASGGLKKTKN